MRRALLVVDNEATPFWSLWDQDWAGSEFEVIPISDFSTLDACLEKIDAEVRKRPDLHQAEWHVVTDSHFPDEGADAGAKLLIRLRSRDDILAKWKRAIVYSDMPRDHPDLHGHYGLRKKGHSKVDPLYIINFLITGQSHSLESLRPILGELGSLLFVCDTLAHRVEGSAEGASLLRALESYGDGVDRQGGQYAFDDLVYAGQNFLLFTPQSSELFGAVVEREFSEGISYFYSPQNVDPKARWQTIMDFLHPAASLIGASSGKGSRLRLLWEIGHTGGSPALLQDHPYHRTDWLDVYQRATLRGHLADLAEQMKQHSTAAALHRLCRDAVAEIEAASELLRQADAGTRDLEPLPEDEA